MGGWAGGSVPGTRSKSILTASQLVIPPENPNSPNARIHSQTAASRPGGGRDRR